MNKDQLRNWAVNNGAVSFSTFTDGDLAFFKPAALDGTAIMGVINIGPDAYAFLDPNWKWTSQQLNGIHPIAEF